MIDHPSEDTLSAALDDPRFARLITVHLATCERCGETFATLRHVRDGAIALRHPIVPPDHLWHRIEPLLDGSAIAPSRRRHAWRELRGPIAGLAAVLILATAVGTWQLAGAWTRATSQGSPRQPERPITAIPGLTALQQLPTASAILARHASATGSLDKRIAVSLTGSISGTGLQNGSRFERYLDRTGRYFQEITRGEWIIERSWWDGAAAFHRTFLTESPPLTPAQAAAIRDHGAAFMGTHSATEQASAVVVERSDFFKCTCIKLRIVLAPANIRNEYYDLQSGLLTGIVHDKRTDAGIATHERLVVLREYRQFNGIMVPTDVLEIDGTTERHLKVDAVRWNPPMPALVAATRRPWRDICFSCR